MRDEIDDQTAFRHAAGPSDKQVIRREVQRLEAIEYAQRKCKSVSKCFAWSVLDRLIMIEAEDSRGIMQNI